MMGFFRCRCGKIHCYGGLTRTSMCPRCGTNLYFYAVLNVRMVLNQNSSHGQSVLAGTTFGVVGTGQISVTLPANYARAWSLSNRR